MTDLPAQWLAVDPAAQLRVVVTTDPPRPQVGQEFVVRLQITNPTDTPVQGVAVGLGGDWDWGPDDLIRVRPNGTLRRDPTGRYIVSALQIPPGESATVEIVTVPRQSTDSILTFSVRTLTPAELVNLSQPGSP